MKKAEQKQVNTLQGDLLKINGENNTFWILHAASACRVAVVFLVLQLIATVAGYRNAAFVKKILSYLLTKSMSVDVENVDLVQTHLSRT